MPIAVGTKAPDFTLKSKDANGLKDVTLSANFGKKNTVLLFFPLAFTGVCTQEFCDITQGISSYAGIGDTSARAAFIVDKNGVVQYAEQTPTPKDLPNFAAIKAKLAELK